MKYYGMIFAMIAAIGASALWAASPGGLRVTLGNVPRIDLEELQNERQIEPKAQRAKQETEAPKSNVAETDLKERVTEIVATLDARLEEIITEREEVIEAYRARFFAHVEAELEAAQARGDLEAYEEWSDRKKRFLSLRNSNDWAYVLRIGCHNRDWCEIEGEYFKSEDFKGRSVLNLEKRYGVAVEKAYQEARKALEVVQRDATKQGEIEKAKSIRDFLKDEFSSNQRESTRLIIAGRERL